MIKKFLFLFFTVFFILGCSDSKDEYQGFVSRSFIGMIQESQVPLEGLEDIYALTTDANSVVYLQSFVHDLTSFVDTRVKVTGDFKVLDLANNNVDFLMVNTIDSLEPAQPTSLQEQLEIYSFAELAIKFPAVAGLEIKQSENSVFFTLDSTNFLVSKKPLNGASYQSYLNEFTDVASDFLLIGESDFNVFFNSDYEQLYITQLNDSVLEIKVSLFESSKQNTVDDFLSSLVILQSVLEGSTDGLTADAAAQELLLDNTEAALNNTVDLSPQEQSTSPELESGAQISSQGHAIDEQLQTNLDSIDSSRSLSAGANSEYTSKLVIGSEPYLRDNSNNSDLNSNYSDVIARFSLYAGSFLNSYESAVEYAFTESNHFYLIYWDKNLDKKRALFSYTTKDFSLVAEFAQDTVMDWKLISGVNPVYDQSLTVFSIDLDNNNFNVHSLKEGFRLFESLPLEFSLHYPKDWFYKRESNAYIFSDSADMTSVLLRVELIDFFDTQTFSRISDDLFFNGGTYIRATSKGKYLRVSANNVSLATLEYIVNSTREL